MRDMERTLAQSRAMGNCSAKLLPTPSERSAQKALCAVAPFSSSYPATVPRPKEAAQETSNSPGRPISPTIQRCAPLSSSSAATSPWPGAAAQRGVTTSRRSEIGRRGDRHGAAGAASCSARRRSWHSMWQGRSGRLYDVVHGA